MQYYVQIVTKILMLVIVSFKDAVFTRVNSMTRVGRRDVPPVARSATGGTSRLPTRVMLLRHGWPAPSASNTRVVKLNRMPN